MKKHEVVTNPPKQPSMRSVNKGALASSGRKRSSTVPTAGGSTNSGPVTSAGEGQKPYGNRNFGRNDHAGTTNVRSKAIVNHPGPGGGTTHISKAGVRPAALGGYARAAIGSGNTSANPPWSNRDPNDMDADDRENPNFRAIPVNTSRGGFD